MSVRIVDGRVDEVELRIFEPPRFFEALLRGRSFLEAPDITSRICGICPVAYQMSSINAMEDLCGVEVSEPIRLLRRPPSRLRPRSPGPRWRPRGIPAPTTARW